MRDSTLRCWRGVQNPAVLRSADHCDEQRVGPIGTFTLRTRCARGGLADHGCTISSAGDTRRGHSQRQQRNQNRIGSTGYHAVCSGAEVEPTARDTRSPDTTAKHTDKPKVRGPIEFDSQKTPTESPSTPSGDEPATAETSQTETSSTPTSDSDSAPDSELKDAA